jgi:hypothetical protein
MTDISELLAHPILGLVGYFFSLLASIVAIWQFIAKRKVSRERDKLKGQLFELNNQIITSSSDEIRQGKKSQYFKDNSGSVNIDNRG